MSKELMLSVEKNKLEIISKTAEFVEQKFSGEATGHDWWHMWRVWQLAKTIAAGEPGANLFTVELGALLHDIADWKFTAGDEKVGPREARAWLEKCQVEEAVIAQIEDIIRTVSFKGAGVASNMKTIEGKIVHDADKLDAIGAIGIARAFAYGGANARPLYDPKMSPKLHTSFEEYKKDNSHTINHFYEKLLLLKDRMYTKTGKKIAKQRHQYMEEYLSEFYVEWNGE